MDENAFIGTLGRVLVGLCEEKSLGEIARDHRVRLGKREELLSCEAADFFAVVFGREIKHRVE